MDAFDEFCAAIRPTLESVAVVGITSDGCCHTMFIGGDNVFRLIGGSAYLHHRLLTEAIHDGPDDAPGPHMTDGTRFVPQAQQDREEGC